MCAEAPSTRPAVPIRREMPLAASAASAARMYDFTPALTRPPAPLSGVGAMSTAEAFRRDAEWLEAFRKDLRRQGGFAPSAAW